MKKLYLLVLIAAPHMCIRSALADAYNLDFFQPTQLIDAYPLQFKQLALQGIVQYQNTETGQDLLTLRPQLEYGGPWPNWQLSITSPIMAGDAPKNNSGDIQVGALWNFFEERTYLPAMALDLELTAPTRLRQRRLRSAAHLCRIAHDLTRPRAGPAALEPAVGHECRCASR